ncbi:MAG: TonB-dependent receptor, partial [Pseudomonadota bacterium]
FFRVEAGINAPVTDEIAVRVDGTYTNRDGFFDDNVNGGQVNDRDRYLIRAQVAYDPTPDLSFRLIGDYSESNEECCAAQFLPASFTPFAQITEGLDTFSTDIVGPGLTTTANPVIPILLALGQDPAALGPGIFERELFITPGRSYAGGAEDYGISLQTDYQLGDISLTSITAYREFQNDQGSDTDYTGVDILFREPGPTAAGREFQTFTQEIRAQGTLFDDRLDWLVGAFYANEDLSLRDNLKFGAQYGVFASCRIALAINPALVNPAAPDCLGETGIGALSAGGGAFGPATPLILAGIGNLSNANLVGDDIAAYNQLSNNFAFFTHNIVHVTDTIDLTLGVRYTNDTKDFDATIDNTNTFCEANRELLSPLLTSPLAGLAGGITALTCVGNSTSELTGLEFEDTRSEDQVTGTAVLSWEPSDETLVYGSYSRGYKAGGFNLDRSALTTSAVFPLSSPLSGLDVDNLQFEEETINAFEVGFKYDDPTFSFAAALFYQEVFNFQLNTFNGSVFVVQNINGCDADLGGADRDDDPTTGACDPSDVTNGVTSQGIEIDAAIRPSDTISITGGFAFTDASYEDNLVGTDDGDPLTPTLRLLPGADLSNAQNYTMTGSFSWTPPIGDTGLTGLVYANTRLMGDFNTGSDLLPAKIQDGFIVTNVRVGISGPDDRWSIEGFAQNLFDVDYTQIAFNTPLIAPQQTFSAFLAEPRTYGVTLRGSF